MSPSFKFDSQHVFLTYSQSTLTCQQIYDHLCSLKTVAWARICQEEHQDGGQHQHVVAKFTSRFQTRNERAFDVAGQHPNVKPVRSVRKSLAYVSKDGEFRDFGPVPESDAREDIDWVEVARTSGRAEYFLRAHRAGVAARYAEIFWDIAARQPSEVPVGYEGNLEWECLELREHQPHERLSTVVIGPTQAGKTSWAKRVCNKPALWVRHLDVLRSFRPGYHRAIIFDDMSFIHLPREAQIHLTDTQDDAHIHVRYGVALIPANTQKIFTANREIFLDDPAINRRCDKTIL